MVQRHRVLECGIAAGQRRAGGYRGAVQRQRVHRGAEADDVDRHASRAEGLDGAHGREARRRVVGAAPLPAVGDEDHVVVARRIEHRRVFEDLFEGLRHRREVTRVGWRLAEGGENRRRRVRPHVERDPSRLTAVGEREGLQAEVDDVGVGRRHRADRHAGGFPLVAAAGQGAEHRRALVDGQKDLGRFTSRLSQRRRGERHHREHRGGDRN